MTKPRRRHWLLLLSSLAVLLTFLAATVTATGLDVIAKVGLSAVFVFIWWLVMTSATS